MVKTVVENDEIVCLKKEKLGNLKIRWKEKLNHGIQGFRN